MMQEFNAHCSSCGTTWNLNPPGTRPMPVEQAIQVMQSGFCPSCRNDGSHAPIRWKVHFSARDFSQCQSS